MTAADADQCHALSADEERCGRTATDGRFCYQHDADDPTIDESEAQTDTESHESADGSTPAILSVREKVEQTATDLIGHDLDGVTEVMRDGDDGWRVVVEVVERHSVPDTQDILGQYEVLLAGDEEIQGYSRLGRHRRADTSSQV